MIEAALRMRLMMFIDFEESKMEETENFVTGRNLIKKVGKRNRKVSAMPAKDERDVWKNLIESFQQYKVRILKYC